MKENKEEYLEIIFYTEILEWKSKVISTWILVMQSNIL